MALNGSLAVGSYSVFVFLTQRFLWPFTSLSVLIDDFERSMASSNRIFELKNTRIIVKDHSDAIETKNLKSDIIFKNIRFSYNESEPILENFKMHIPFGSSYGIVGDTGSGKTTISKLLFPNTNRNPSSNTITIVHQSDSEILQIYRLHFSCFSIYLNWYYNFFIYCCFEISFLKFLFA